MDSIGVFQLSTVVDLKKTSVPWCWMDPGRNYAPFYCLGVNNSIKGCPWQFLYMYLCSRMILRCCSRMCVHMYALVIISNYTFKSHVDILYCFVIHLNNSIIQVNVFKFDTGYIPRSHRRYHSLVCIKKYLFILVLWPIRDKYLICIFLSIYFVCTFDWRQV